MPMNVTHIDVLNRVNANQLGRDRLADALFTADHDADFCLDHEEIVSAVRALENDRQLSEGGENHMKNELYRTYAELASPAATNTGVAHRDLISRSAVNRLGASRLAAALHGADRNRDMVLDHDELRGAANLLENDRQLSEHGENHVVNEMYANNARLTSPESSASGVPHRSLMDASDVNELGAARMAVALHRADSNRDMVLQRDELRAAQQLIENDRQLSERGENHLNNELQSAFVRLSRPSCSGGVCLRGGS